jgi:hypothetical protein
MKMSYAIMVCNESRDLYSLVSFLKKVKDCDDEINILIDTVHVTNAVRGVITHFKDDVVVHERAFDGNFSDHRNYHLEKCSGDYIFIIDPDEMPQEALLKNMKKMISESGADLIMVPRINICPGFTEEWLKKCNFRVNQTGWINWPDYICRIFKNGLKYGNEVHENIVGAEKRVVLQDNPQVAVWHIKSVEKQDNRWDSDGNFVTPVDGNLYDTLM